MSGYWSKLLCSTWSGLLWVQISGEWGVAHQRLLASENRDPRALLARCGVVCVILRLAVLTIPACDRRADRQTNRHTASTALAYRRAGKMFSVFIHTDFERFEVSFAIRQYRIVHSALRQAMSCGSQACLRSVTPRTGVWHTKIAAVGLPHHLTLIEGQKSEGMHFGVSRLKEPDSLTCAVCWRTVRALYCPIQQLTFPKVV